MMSVLSAIGSTSTERTVPHARHEYATQRKVLVPRTYPSTSSMFTPSSDFSHLGHFAKAMSLSFLKWLVCSDSDHKRKGRGAQSLASPYFCRLALITGDNH